VFSSRLPDRLAPNRLAVALARARDAGRRVIDLTLSNPTRADIPYAPDLLAALSAPESLVYAPQPLGSIEARRAVAADFGRRGIEIDPARIALTASTSEAYSVLFKLLTDPGDEVLVPRPSYPLFEHLTRLDGVHGCAYDLEFHGRWSIDVNAVRAATSSSTRAVLIVSPNNPTGSFVGRRELDEIAALCGERGIAVIADEVFADYELDGSPDGRPPSALGSGALTFALGGLSKSVGLPQIKAGWIAVSGPDAQVDAALERLELVCDTYLSVSTPVQTALPTLISRGATVRDAIRARVRGNYRALRDRAALMPACRLLPAEGGWYAVLQVPAVQSEDELVLALLEEEDVLVHPGYFFDFQREAYVVVSLLVQPDLFVDGMNRLLRVVSGA